MLTWNHCVDGTALPDPTAVISAAHYGAQRIGASIAAAMPGIVLLIGPDGSWRVLPLGGEFAAT
jgi:hypothetical protein